MQDWQRRRWKVAMGWGLVPSILFMGAGVIYGDASNRAIVMGVGVVGGVLLALMIGFARPTGRDD